MAHKRNPGIKRGATPSNWPKLKRGDRVRVPQWAAISNVYCRGKVASCDGVNVMVRLNYRGIKCHHYVNEVTKGWRVHRP